MATIIENTESMSLAFSTHMKNKNPDVDTQTIDNIDEFSLAYATAIANAIGAGTTGGNLGDYIKKTGEADGVMSGKFTALYGFEAGNASIKSFEANSDGVKVFGKLEHDGDAFSGNNKTVLDYSENTLTLNSNDDFIGGVAINGTKLSTPTAIQVGPDTISGFFADLNNIKYKNFDVYHAGNINKSDIDLDMHDADISGALTVTGLSTFNGGVSALNGFIAGLDGTTYVEVSNNNVGFNKDLTLASGVGVKTAYNSDYILKDYNNGSVSINAAGESLFLGYANTSKVIMSSDLYNDDGNRKLIDKDGGGSFLYGFSLGYGGVSKLSAIEHGVLLSGGINIDDDGTILSKGVNNLMKITCSTSDVIEIGADGTSAIFNTNKDNIKLNKKTEVIEAVQISGSQTRMADGKLYLSDNHYLQSLTSGIKVFGRVAINNEIGTPDFSTGFSGSGWEIDSNANATFSSLVVRDTLKVYEFDVQKITAMNGSLWISANCSGSKVTKL